MDPEASKGDADEEIIYRSYRDEDSDLPAITRLVETELSEPYTIYTYRYFLLQWPKLAFLACDATTQDPVGIIVCKQDLHRRANRGYIAMLSISPERRKRGIAIKLAELAIAEMIRGGADEIVLETEYDNVASLALYERLGFLREKRLHRFYLNGKDAFRLVLPVTSEDLEKVKRSAPPVPPRPVQHVEPPTLQVANGLREMVL